MKSTAAVPAENNVTSLHLAAHGERTTVVRSKLFKAPENVRKAPRSAESIAELAALIKSQGGVLENLVVYAERKKGKATGKYAVTAGGGRLDAVDLLISQSEFDPEYAFPVLIVPQHLAVEVSIVENSGREPMHPADEFDAFLAMHKEGKSHEDIAARFGVQPVVVVRRLKLAKVAPELFELYRAGGMNLEQLMAFTVVDDHEKQVMLWESMPSYERNAWQIRAALTAGEENIARNRFGKFVGAEAFEAAGGVIRRDLFSASGDGYISDMPLLLKLAKEKLDAEAERLLASGTVAWVDIVQDISAFDHSAYSRINKVQREATPEEAAAIEAAQNEVDRVDAAIEDASADDDEDEEKLEALYQESEAAETLLRNLEGALYEVPAEHAAQAGVVIGVDNNGALSVKPNLLRKEVAQNDADSNNDGGANSGQQETTSKRPAHSEKLVRMLTAQRTAALQRVLADRHDIALIALTAQLATDFRSKYYAGSKTVQISATVEYLESHGGDNIKQSRAYLEFQALAESWQERLAPVEDVFEWLLTQDQSVTMELLAFCVSRSLTTIQLREDSDSVKFAPLAKALALNMSDWWKPTADNYLAHVSKAKVIETAAEALGAEATTDLHAMKREPLVGLVASRMESSTWLPALLKV